MSKINLKAGDVVYREGYNGSITGKLTIERVTDTLAISGTTRIKQHPYDTSKFKIFGTGYDVFVLPNEDSEEKYQVYVAAQKAERERKQYVSKLYNTKWDTIPADKLRQIISILHQ